MGDWSISTILSIYSRPSMRSWGAACSRAPFRRRADGLVQGLDHQGGFAAARNAGDAGEGAQREVGRDVLQIVAPGIDHLQGLAAALAALLRHFDLALAGQILAGDAVGIGHDLGGSALGDDRAAMDAGSRAHVDQIIGGADGVFVMFDHDHRIADVAQALQGGQQAVVVALMQADGGLVQHIEHAGEARADLRGQTDALALAARQSAGIARQADR